MGLRPVPVAANASRRRVRRPILLEAVPPLGRVVPIISPRPNALNASCPVGRLCPVEKWVISKRSPKRAFFLTRRCVDDIVGSPLSGLSEEDECPRSRHGPACAVSRLRARVSLHRPTRSDSRAHCSPSHRRPGDAAAGLDAGRRAEPRRHASDDRHGSGRRRSGRRAGGDVAEDGRDRPPAGRRPDRGSLER